MRILVTMDNLKSYGWSDERAGGKNGRMMALFRPVWWRILGKFTKLLRLVGDRPGFLALWATNSTVDMPKIGDWVAVELHDDSSATIPQVLARTTEITRGQAGAFG